MKNEFDGLVNRLLGANVSLQEATEILERSMISEALTRHHGNQSAASKQLGVHRNTLQRKVREYELKRKPIAREARARRRRTGTD
jgi:Fis family transcriptional regulator, factor for inversion stimulation protein